MEMDIKKQKSFMTISAIAFILYAFINMNPMNMMWGKIVGVAFSIVYFAMGIATFASSKRNSNATTFFMGLVSVANLIPLLFVCVFMIIDYESIGILWMIVMGVRVATFVLLTMNSIMKFENLKDKFWIIPLVLEAIYTLVCIGIYSWYGYYMLRLNRFFIGEIILCLGIFLFSKAILNRPDNSQDEQSATTKNSGYCDMTKHILLLVFIGWIWQYIWIYRTTDYLNKTPNEEKRDPATKLLLCMFVPFYYIYWIYQSARRIEILAKEKNIDSDIVTLSVVLSLFVGIVPPIIMQSKLNQICKTEDKNTTATETYTVQQKVETNSDKTDEIRNYKKLLDDGIITEEEFEAKKKQLLGL